MIWFFGDSIVYWSLLQWFDQGCRPEFLPFHCEVRNFAHRGRTFQGVIKDLLDVLKSTNEIPVLIVFHVGTNNMGSITAKDFTLLLEQTMAQISDIIRESPIAGAQGYMGFLWSDILPHLWYRWSANVAKADKVRKMFNRKAHALLGPSGNRFVKHESITYQVRDNYRTYYVKEDPHNPRYDPIHLSPGGINKFLLNIANMAMYWAHDRFEV